MAMAEDIAIITAVIIIRQNVRVVRATEEYNKKSDRVKSVG